MSYQLPKPRKAIPDAVLCRPWVVHFDLAYDGGGSAWTQYYRTKVGAVISMWWKYYISSWGGTARLEENKHQGKFYPDHK